MPIPETELHRAEQALAKFCDRVPPEIRPELSYYWTIERNQITLVEKRPHFQRRGEFTHQKIARFQYRASRRTWTLKWADRDGDFHIYPGFEDRIRFQPLLDEVDRDPTGIFFG